MRVVFCAFLVVAWCLTCTTGWASTGSLSGVIVHRSGEGANEDLSARDERHGVYGKLAVESTFLWYVSKGGFHITGGRTAGKVGEVFGGMVTTKASGTFTLLNGEPIHPGAFWNACKPGRWGSFYEGTYHNVNTFPMPKTGSFVGYAPTKSELTLRHFYADSGRHTPYNPAQEISHPLDKDVMFTLDGEQVDPGKLSGDRTWVYLYPARNQIIDIRRPAAAMSAKHLYDPADHGGKVTRGDANILCGPGVFTDALPPGTTRTHTTFGLNAKTPASFGFERYSYKSGEWSRYTFSRSSAGMYFILDGLWADPAVCLRPGWRFHAWHYRDLKGSPSFYAVVPNDDRIRGRVISVDGNDLVIDQLRSKDESLGEVRVSVRGNAELLLDGEDSSWDALPNVVGATVLVFPKRPMTVAAYSQAIDLGPVYDWSDDPGIRVKNLGTHAVKEMQGTPLPEALVEQLLQDPEVSLAWIERRMAETERKGRELKPETKRVHELLKQAVTNQANHDN